MVPLIELMERDNPGSQYDGGSEERTIGDTIHGAVYFIAFGQLMSTEPPHQPSSAVGPPRAPNLLTTDTM